VDACGFTLGRDHFLGTACMLFFCRVFLSFGVVVCVCCVGVVSSEFGSLRV